MIDDEIGVWYWVFEDPCENGQPHRIESLELSYDFPFRCARCGAVAAQRERTESA